ncbi:ankyrin repeat-containing domain protein [Mycena galopus ATCC 62051]|nr:ankyrin repeat-containing domain protein [Mycena galopus ATCC 62051]
MFLGQPRNCTPLQWYARRVDRRSPWFFRGWPTSASPLWIAASADLLEIATYLLSEGAPPNGSGFEYVSALGVASYYGHIDMVRLLLTAGARPNAAGVDPLQLACARYHVDIVRILIENNFNVNATEQFNKEQMACTVILVHWLSFVNKNHQNHYTVELSTWHKPLAAAYTREECFNVLKLQCTVHICTTHSMELSHWGLEILSVPTQPMDATVGILTQTHHSGINSRCNLWEAHINPTSSGSRTDPTPWDGMIHQLSSGARAITGAQRFQIPSGRIVTNVREESLRLRLSAFDSIVT